MNVFLTKRLYHCLITVVLLFIAGYFFQGIYPLAKVFFYAVALLVTLDIFLLFRTTKPVKVKREVPERLSNGETNHVAIIAFNLMPYALSLEILDELPVQLQIRDFMPSILVRAGERKQIHYQIFPKTRGAYKYGLINVLIKTKLGLIIRKYKQGNPTTVKVYPSFIKIHQFELKAISQNQRLSGEKRIRRTGDSNEFDSIKPYVIGDDPRRLNWKATARKNSLQINHFNDEKSQDIYSFIDKSRSMKMPFNQMTLLDYAINACLVLSYVAINRSDQSGLLSFEDKPQSFLKASRSPNQIHKIIECLYKEETSFKEVDFTSLYTYVGKKITNRSLIILFTNFETVQSLSRQLDYLKLLNRKHLLLVVIFQNSEVQQFLGKKGASMRSIYEHSIASDMMIEKKLISDTLKFAGILNINTSPEKLNIDVVNKYIEIKKRQLV